jgi:hypothetical protein
MLCKMPSGLFCIVLSFPLVLHGTQIRSERSGLSTASCPTGDAPIHPGLHVMRFSELVSSIRGSGVGNPFCVSVRCPIGSSGHYGVGPPPDLDFSWILEREEREREREKEERCSTKSDHKHKYSVLLITIPRILT